jgi:hypothetical protein
MTNVHDETVRKPRRRRLRQIESVTIHCAVCMQQGKTIPAFTIANSYAVCKPHVKVADRKNFSLFDLVERRAT